MGLNDDKNPYKLAYHELLRWIKKEGHYDEYLDSSFEHQIDLHD